ncbi:hypothetical protein OUO06_06785 [Photobacterium damselae]|uniref:hypothetical protein n=1 Tax=Photobacterium damselae TaxID=38293 RepID=UPI003C6E3F31
MKPTTFEAMRNIISQVKTELPLYDESTFTCGPDNSCIGCPKKLMEMLESEVSYWEHALDRGIKPNFDDLYRFGKMCKNIKRGLVRNNLIKSDS